jgi:hypothetical protein
LAAKDIRLARPLSAFFPLFRRPAEQRKKGEGRDAPKTFVLMPGNGHNDQRSDEYFRALETFFTKLTAP